jgi:hypothetical protein
MELAPTFYQKMRNEYHTPTSILEAESASHTCSSLVGSILFGPTGSCEDTLCWLIVDGPIEHIVVAIRIDWAHGEDRAGVQGRFKWYLVTALDLLSAPYVGEDGGRKRPYWFASTTSSRQTDV